MRAEFDVRGLSRQPIVCYTFSSSVLRKFKRIGSVHSEEVGGVHDFHLSVSAELQEMAVARNDIVGIAGHRAVNELVVFRIVPDDCSLGVSAYDDSCYCFLAHSMASITLSAFSPSLRILAWTDAVEILSVTGLSVRTPFLTSASKTLVSGSFLMIPAGRIIFFPDVS